MNIGFCVYHQMSSYLRDKRKRWQSFGGFSGKQYLCTNLKNLKHASNPLQEQQRDEEFP